MTRISLVLIAALPLLAVFPAAAQAPAPHPATAVSERALDAHLRFLADDALEGRGAGSRGDRLAALYIAAQFRRLGLEPDGDDGTYLQHFTMLGYRPTAPHDVGQPALPDTGGELRFGTDFVAREVNADTVVDLSAEAVFVGYGIVAPHYGRNDYGDIDVRGRVLIALAGSPLVVDSSRTLGTYYGELNYKADEARRRGAVALLLVEHPASRSVRWEDATPSFLRARWLPAGLNDPLRVVGVLNTARAESLALRQATSLAALARAADGDAFAASSLGSVRLHFAGTIEQRLESTNVTGCLPGTGAQAHERVLLGGHYDHLGIGSAIDGDSIYNGALDNASGTATMLAVAEALATSAVRPRRTLCLIAFGAEERGMVGSRAYIARESEPSRIVAMLNIDGANVWGLTRDIAVLGQDQSTLGPVLERAVASEGLTLIVHPHEVRERFFFRSDHLSFLRAGIPAIFMRRGKDLLDPGDFPWQERWDEYYAERYHKPQDHVLDWYSADGAAQQARVLIRAMLEIADAPDRPAWVEASEFHWLTSTPPARLPTIP